MRIGSLAIAVAAFAAVLALGACAFGAGEAEEAAEAPRTIPDGVLPPECMPRGGLPNVFGKLHRGEPVRIAYLGGSVTDAKGWRVMTEAWFKERYPDSEITACNAAHSGTGSALACFRLERDCLGFNPDLLFVEFAVNDIHASVETIHRGIEGIVRQARRANPKMDICFVYTLESRMVKPLQEGTVPFTAKAMEAIAEHYNLPSIHMGLEVVRLEKQGKLQFRGKYPETDEEKAALGDRILFCVDGVHPLTEGHELYRDAVARGMGKMEPLGAEGPAPMPKPFRADNYEYVRPTPLSQVTLSEGWRKLDPDTDAIAKRFQGKLPELWCADTPGASITVRFKGDSILVYDLVGPDCGQVIITVDGGDPRVRPRFDAWTTNHRVYYFIAADDLEVAEHTARFELDANQPDKKAILAQRGVEMDDPARYDGARWYVGEILVTGQVLPAE